MEHLLGFNYCTKFQTICFGLSLNYIHFFLKNQPFACLIMPLPTLHIADICKLGKGINYHANSCFFRKNVSLREQLKGLN
jgi:hypothetical protein